MIATRERQRTPENSCGSECKGGEESKLLSEKWVSEDATIRRRTPIPPKTRRLVYVYSHLVKIAQEIDVLYFSLCLGTANTMNTEFSVLEVE